MTAALAQIKSPRLLLCSNGVRPSTFWGCINSRREARDKEILSDDKSKPKRLVYIPTASMFLDKDSHSSRSLGQRRQRARASMRKQMASLVTALEAEDRGRLQATFLDYSDSKISAEEASAIIEESDAVWLEGGNTFFLAHHLKRLDFKASLSASLRDPLVVGVSAGAIVSGKTTRTALWKGWDNPIPEVDISDEKALTGLGLVSSDVSFFPHYESSWADKVGKEMLLLDHTCVLLRDHAPTDADGNSNGSASADEDGSIVAYWQQRC